ncbi:glycosyltransferase family 32 protein [Mediterranea massiliensis]|uniref:glycosyltransferase family 32 protein n=1 Tax=Mediterranea massiliensis TaxID=1841865 RepID=UPI000934A63F|nr:glycosyltransferase [Mediterranea massiliensis]
MIPKTIHYCWFGRNPLPPLAIKCIASWKKYLPDYEIKEWNEDNFDVNIIPYTKEAYEAKKYAFVSDYTRFWILYHYGGLYFDTDVEVIKPLDDIIDRGAFMGLERDYEIGATMQYCTVAPGLGLGCNPGLGQYKKILDFYATLHFRNKDDTLNLKTIVEYTTNLLIQDGLSCISGIQKIGDIYIYPSEYFCPINIITKKMHITKNTRTIHHYMASWQETNFLESTKNILRKIIPQKILLWYNRKRNK